MIPMMIAMFLGWVVVNADGSWITGKTLTFYHSLRECERHRGISQRCAPIATSPNPPR
jgi:hypothetical protein